MIQLAWPWIFLLLPLPWLCRRILPPASPSGGLLFAPFFDNLENEGGAAFPASRRLGILAIIIWMALLTAAVRTQWLGEPIKMPENGRNLMLGIDISGSMEMADLDISNKRVTRLDVVKQVAGDFIQRRSGDRVGLILFGSSAYLQSPLSFDRKTVYSFLRDAVIGLAGKETAIGDAIGLAIKRLKSSAKSERTVFVLLTDGVNNAGAVNPRQAAQLAAEANLTIYTIAIGAEAMETPGFFGSRIINPSANLDEKTLKYIAATTGGQYFRAQNRDALTKIYQRLDELEPVAGSDRIVRPVDELYIWPLGLALLLSLLLAYPHARRAD